MFWHIWRNNRSFLGVSACQLQAVEQVFFGSVSIIHKFGLLILFLCFYILCPEGFYLPVQCYSIFLTFLHFYISNYFFKVVISYYDKGCEGLVLLIHWWYNIQNVPVRLANGRYISTLHKNLIKRNYYRTIKISNYNKIVIKKYFLHFLQNIKRTGVSNITNPQVETKVSGEEKLCLKKGGLIHCSITEPMSILNHLNGIFFQKKKNIAIRKYLARKEKQKKVGALQNETQNLKKLVSKFSASHILPSIELLMELKMNVVGCTYLYYNVFEGCSLLLKWGGNAEYKEYPICSTNLDDYAVLRKAISLISLTAKSTDSNVVSECMSICSKDNGIGILRIQVPPCKHTILMRNCRCCIHQLITYLLETPSPQTSQPLCYAPPAAEGSLNLKFYDYSVVFCDTLASSCVLVPFNLSLSCSMLQSVIQSPPVCICRCFGTVTVHQTSVESLF
ncbi:hypothetical protein VP01_3202g1 [Puccinia sorghi]|uniref:Uncharacterized protein n=1 Tax=Puccinia sorghi TaxID=27349 RepID=A0A0L6V0A9_9BASI|nr:hypothetical protein VP01_3202g1 [Puccinia sorghi]